MWSLTHFRACPGRPRPPLCCGSRLASFARRWVSGLCSGCSWFVPAQNLVAAVPRSSPVALRSLSGLLPPVVDKEVATWHEIRFDSLDAVSSELDAYTGRPIILYLNAPIAVGPLVSLADRAGGGDRAEESTRVIGGTAIDRFWRLCRDRHGENKLLVVIDPGRVGPDALRGAGDDSSQDWLAALEREGTPPTDPQKRREWDKTWRNFGVFCAVLARTGELGRRGAGPDHF